MRFKILGMALLACVATSAFAATNASGTADGHFTHEGPTNNAIITGHEGTYPGSEHSLVFTRLVDGSHATTSESLHCETSRYDGTVTAKTVTVIEVFPVYEKCTTPGGTAVTVDTEHCSYTFHSQGARTHGTVTIDCPAGQSIKITHPNCEITIPAQTTASTLTEGIYYDTTVEGKHSLTATVTVNTITGHYHGGICIFLGTSHKYEMKGSVTVKGYEHLGGSATLHTLKEGAQIPITST